jgi:hypothetical protein
MAALLNGGSIKMRPHRPTPLLFVCGSNRLKYSPAQGHMTRGSATTTDICHPPGDGVDSCTNATTHAKLTANS